MSYGDYEPEDAWDVGDTTPALLHNLRERVDLLGATRSYEQGGESLEDIERDVAYWAARRGTFDTRAMIRLDDLITDLAYVRAR